MSNYSDLKELVEILKDLISIQVILRDRGEDTKEIDSYIDAVYKLSRVLLP